MSAAEKFVEVSRLGSKVTASGWYLALPFEAQFAVRKAFQEASAVTDLDPRLRKLLKEQGLT